MAQNTRRFKVSGLAAVILVVLGSLCAMASGVPALASGHATAAPGSRSVPARPASRAASGATDANAYASSRAVVYQPKVQYDSRHGARVTVVEYCPGIYGIVFAGSGSQAPEANPGDIQVTTVGTGRQCTFSDWDQELTPFAYVCCYTGAGNLARAAFTVQWVVA